LGAGKLATEKYAVTTARGAVRIPRAARLAATPSGLHPDVPGLGPFFTPNGSFYRVDTALVLPQVDPASWTLRIDGMVDRPAEISYDQLLRRTLEEHDMTLSCVSNDVGGPYVGNARWIGAPLAPLLRQAGLRPGADQVLARSADGMTIGTPLASVLDGRASLLAVAMNGQPLPVQHGFPCRVLVPGLYGYSSACKWVTELTVTTYQAQAAYWVQQGYAQIGTMKIASRIDVPRSSARVAAGTVTVAGIAWATHRGIDAVEVRVDNGTWQQASIAAQDTPDTWRQWSYDWQAQPGTHTLQVRAVDGSGTVQTGAQQQPFPSGATGWHTISVTVA
jgi:DMSO/TMAO reductase YedYZ molybdopterin-dependent catalytic subunit